MKRIFLICVVFLLVAFSSVVFGETIYLRDGSIVTGDIIKTTADSIVVKTDYGEFTISKDKIERVEYEKPTSVLLAQEQESVPSSGILKKNSFGLGLGVPYGVLGLNLDINVAPNLNLSLGVGTTIFAGIGYNFGLKYFFTSIERTFRPRASAYYGVNAMVLKQYIGIDKEDEGESYTGLSLGIGTQWMWGKTKSKGLDFDIIFIATTGFDAEELRDEGFDVEEYGKVKISVGYRYAF